MPRQLEVIFCDDVRTETHNKISFMGVYGGALLVERFPAALSKLCIVPSLSTPLDQPFKELAFVILAGEKEVGRVQLPSDAMETAQSDLGAEPMSEKARGLLFRSVITIAPFACEAPTVLQVDAIVDGERVEGPRLRVYTGQKPRQSEQVKVPLVAPTTT